MTHIETTMEGAPTGSLEHSIDEEIERLDRMLESGVVAKPVRYADDQNSEACRVAWSGLHRTIAEGGNEYME